MAKSSERFRCRATVTAFSKKPAFHGRGHDEIILLRHIIDADTSAMLMHKQWLVKGVWAANLKAGDEITFEASAIHNGQSWKLGRLSNVVRIPQKPQESPTAPLQAI